MSRSFAALSLAVLTLTALGSGCTRWQQRQVNRAWRDTRGNVFNRVNLNSGSKADLAALPGLDDSDADAIIKHRPYGAVKGLLRKNVISKAKYDQIQDYVYVQ